jgi:hypothetical protein
MKVTKIFCDICGEEIPDYVHQSVELSGNVNMYSSLCRETKLEVCRQCGVEFFLLVDKIKNNIKKVDKNESV